MRLRPPRGLLREIEAADEKIEAAVSGRAGRFRITATPVWVQAIVAPALDRYREALPGVELALRAASFAEGLRLLENGESDLHCGGADPGRPLPAFLRRERFIELTAGIVAGDGHPLLTRRPALRDLSGYPWIDYDASVFTAPGAGPPGDVEPSLDPVLERLFRETGRRVSTVLRAGAAALLPMAAGPWLARLPLELLDRLAEPPAKTAVHALRPAALQGGLHRPAFGRGSRAVPGAGGNRARDCPGAKRPIPRPARKVSALTFRLATAWVPRRMQTDVYRRRRLRVRATPAR